MCTGPRSTMRATRALFAICAISLISVLAAGCGESATSPQSPNITVYLSSKPLDIPPAASAAHRPSAMNMGGIPVEAVDSINIEIFGVAAIQPTDTADYSAAIDPSASGLHRVNFRKLPVTGIDSLEIARDRIPARTYGALRVRFKSASITFNTAVTVRGRLFEPGTYQLDIPHGITFASDVPSDAFTIGGSNKMTAINVSFDIGSSISSITIGAVDLLQMNPIFTATAFTK